MEGWRDGEGEHAVRARTSSLTLHMIAPPKRSPPHPPPQSSAPSP